MTPDSEPAIVAGSVVALATAVIGVAVAFGAPLTTEQKEAVIGLVSVAAPIVAGLLIRGHVTPEATIDQVPIARAALDEAHEQKKDAERIAKQV